MKKLLIILTLITTPSLAQQHTWASSTPEDMEQEMKACAPDINRYCGGAFSMLIFETESCLTKYVDKLTPECKDQIAPTDFRKYHH